MPARHLITAVRSTSGRKETRRNLSKFRSTVTRAGPALTDAGMSSLSSSGSPAAVASRSSPPSGSFDPAGAGPADATGEGAGRASSDATGGLCTTPDRSIASRWGSSGDCHQKHPALFDGSCSVAAPAPAPEDDDDEATADSGGDPSGRLGHTWLSGNRPSSPTSSVTCGEDESVLLYHRARGEGRGWAPYARCL